MNLSFSGGGGGTLQTGGFQTNTAVKLRHLPQVRYRTEPRGCVPEACPHVGVAKFDICVYAT